MMTVDELIAQLQKWPLHAEVVCTKEVEAPGSSPIYTVVRVGGIAGAHISGRDSVVDIVFK